MDNGNNKETQRQMIGGVVRRMQIGRIYKHSCSEEIDGSRLSYSKKRWI